STQGYPRRDGVPDGRPYRRPPSGRGGDGRRGRRGAQGEGRSVARGRELRTPERRDDLVSATQPLPRHPLPRGDPVTDHPIDTEALRVRAEHVYPMAGLRTLSSHWPRTPPQSWTGSPLLSIEPHAPRHNPRSVAAPSPS